MKTIKLVNRNQVVKLSHTGRRGLAGTITVGTVTTGAPDQSATVTNVGTPSEAILNFVIPQGVQGDPATNLVQSVNGKQGTVVLNHTDVGADPAGSASQALQDANDYTDGEVYGLDAELATVAKTGSYNDLDDKPTIPTVQSVNGRTGNVTGLAEASDLTAHTGNTSNPHSVTKAQVGLGNVDNTSDSQKNSAAVALTNKTIDGGTY